MDVQILRAIVESRSEVMKEVDDPETFERSLRKDKFPLTDPAILAALARSFTSLISYKVSPEAYQRYSVRLQVIEVLRDWLRPSKQLKSSRALSHGERALEFATKILRVYLKNEILFQGDESTDVLVTLARALLCLLPGNKTYLPDLEKLLDRITGFRQTEDSRRLLLSAVKEKESLGISYQTLERLYVCQNVKLIEEPLTEHLIVNLRDSMDATAPYDLNISHGLEELLKVAAESPTVFQVASSVLKEILVHSNYSTKVVDYINFFLKSLDSHCQEINKNVLDLYPLHLQSCVLLLNIEPEQHTTNSRTYVLKCLEKIRATNVEEALILFSHFPSWLNALGAHLGNSPTVMEMSD